jgi:telomerase Cajal body protein 1
VIRAVDTVDGIDASCFLKALYLSPDGRALLATHEDSNIVKYHQIDSDIIDGNKYYDNVVVPECDERVESNLDCPDDDQVRGSCEATSNASTMHETITVGESIHDCKWYPFMNLQEPSTCCFITASRDHPIHLWDLASGKVRCSYVGHNDKDELDLTASVTFNTAGDRIYAGSNRMIRCFDVSNPGLGNSFDIPTTRSRRDMTGQKGIISTLAFSPDYSKTYAAGSFAHSIGIYVEDMDGCALELRDLDIGGITCLKWSPCGHYLWSGGRNTNSLVCWDIRKTGHELGRVARSSVTNQRMSFDIDPWGKYLATGTSDGEVKVYDTTTFELAASLRPENLNADCMNSVAFHPYSSILVTGSGQRHFNDFSDDDDDSNSDDDEEVGGSTVGGERVVKRQKVDDHPKRSEVHANILFWRVDKEPLQYEHPSHVAPTEDA